ncbi:MBL fold metallo-hydrolase [Lysinibacillus sp. 1P01SD]|uniref:MBL fold metallo-hydrolase n=1 Tax=Lysinibacillus sp. 1P01SD TaxID=3132285 RepID=UPI0039A0BEFD
MIKINHLSRFHKVGQGLFYSATIKNIDSDENIKYIIDCGTSKGATELKMEIEEYLINLNKDSCLDILIISHFHQDHISGLKQLLEGFVQKNIRIKNFFIPYYTKMQRNYLYIYWSKKLSKSEGWILDFILNPVGFLDNFNIVNNLIFIHPSDLNNTEINNNAVLPLSDDDSVKIVGTNVLGIESENVSHMLTLYHLTDVKVTILALIEFDFWVKKCNPDLLEEFTSNMDRIISSGSSLQTIASKISKDKRVYAAYKKLHEDFNDTSLCVLISNVSEIIKARCYFLGDNYLGNSQNLSLNWPSYNSSVSFRGVKLPLFREKLTNRAYLCVRYAYFGYLFTGDINLSANKNGTKSDTYIDFVNHYQDKLKRVQFLTVPHHGSRHNWDNRLLSDCNYPISVISSAQTGKYGHPDYIVVRDIESYGWAWSNEDVSIDILQRMVF